MDPKGHAAIVTGAASGLGAETAVQLATAGMKVACLDVNVDGAKAVAQKVGGIAVRCDVTSWDDQQARHETRVPPHHSAAAGERGVLPATDRHSHVRARFTPRCTPWH